MSIKKIIFVIIYYIEYYIDKINFWKIKFEKGKEIGIYSNNLNGLKYNIKFKSLFKLDFS